jgi:drug/metabolite transporter (DMT)-like permease
VVWGDVPNPLAVAGIAVIVGSGLYILHRQRLRAA